MTTLHRVPEASGPQPRSFSPRASQSCLQPPRGTRLCVCRMLWSEWLPAPVSGRQTPHPDGAGSQGGRGLCLQKRSHLWNVDSAPRPGQLRRGHTQPARNHPPGARGRHDNAPVALPGLNSGGESRTGGALLAVGEPGGETTGGGGERAPPTSRTLREGLCVTNLAPWGDMGLPGGGRGQGGKWATEMPYLPGPSSPYTWDTGLAGPWAEGPLTRPYARLSTGPPPPGTPARGTNTQGEEDSQDIGSLGPQGINTRTSDPVQGRTGLCPHREAAA